jgi:regulator of sigma E protease
LLATVIVLGILIFVHEFGHFLVAKLLRVRVEAFSLGFPPKLLGKKIGDTEYRLSFIPLGGYVKLLGENPKDEVPPELLPYSFLHHPLWHRFLIVVAGPAFNLLFTVLALFLVFAVSGIPYLPTEIGGVKADSPAALAGIQAGDQIVAVDRIPVNRWDDMVDKVRTAGAGGRALTLGVQRQDRSFEVQVVPQRMEAQDVFGAKISTWLIGISAGDRLIVDRVGPLTALQEGLVYSYRLCWLTVQSVYKLLAREMPLKSLGGPIFIAQVAGKQAELGVTYLIQFMAILSVNLALLNLLPIPILDGGHLFFFLLEAIRGRPLALKHREMAQALGLMMLLALMLLVFYQDVLRLVSQHH